MNPFAALAQPVLSRPGMFPKAAPRVAAPKPAKALAKRRGTADLPAVPNPWKLSPVQCEVLRQVVEGGTAKTIGASLGLSFKTVDVHFARLKEKMEVRSILQAALLWDRQQRFHGFVPTAVFVTDVSGRSQQCVVMARDLEPGEQPCQ